MNLMHEKTIHVYSWVDEYKLKMGLFVGFIGSML